MLLSIVLALAGCSATSSHDVGAGDTCLATETELAVDEVSALGFSAQEVLDFLATGFESTLAWTDGGNTTITFAITPGERGYWFADVEDNPDDDVACEVDDFMYVGAVVAWTTRDDSFEGTVDYVVTAVAVDDVSATFNPPFDDLPDTDCAVGEGYELEMHGAFDSAGASGTLDCEGTGTSTVASWSP